jgi:hypothetical protein
MIMLIDLLVCWNLGVACLRRGRQVVLLATILRLAAITSSVITVIVVLAATSVVMTVVVVGT